MIATEVLRQRQAKVRKLADTYAEAAAKHRSSAERAAARGDSVKTDRANFLACRAEKLAKAATADLLKLTRRIEARDATRRSMERQANRMNAAAALRRAGRPPKGGAQKRRLRAVKPVTARDTLIEIGSKLVEDPYEEGADLVVAVNIRESPLEHMKARRRIGDAEYEAGRRFRSIYERSCIGAMGAIDPAKDVVDGGKFRDVQSLSVMLAHDELRRLRSVVREVGMVLLTAIVGRGEPIARVAEVWGRTVAASPDGRARRTRSSEDIVGARLIEALRDLADHWGARGNYTGTIVAARDLGVPHA